MNQFQKCTVYISIVAIAFFLALSLLTQHWGFFLWSVLPVFIVLMTAFSKKTTKEVMGNEWYILSSCALSKNAVTGLNWSLFI
ncbi:hypothetical protein [Sporosarcina sp. P7]|uniref:hypothetical protein n=1 Tax=Sporosarcina sp. P7 TaxID=2048244 RepID=UPI000C16353F|nr:hypothetical protein [Sporosarcina sp. P7]PID24144.1 hypothetical protein CSV60_10660 [Sporosarcina sp. P7]